MTVIAFGAVRSCGLTTLALALAATWPDAHRVLLAECDPVGGTLAAASGWAPEPGSVSLAAAARRDTNPELIWEHCHELVDGASVLAAPSSADQARSALGMLAGLLERLGELSADVLLDCGRLAGISLSPVMVGADRVILAARPALADLHALATWCEAHRIEPSRLGMVLVGEGTYSNAEVAEALSIEVLARIPWDPQAAASLVSVSATARELSRSPLVRSARSLAEHLSSQPPPAGGIDIDSGARLTRIRALRSGGSLRGRRFARSSRAANGSGPVEVRS
jgi:MinD-like ATPase involved in chromosome partitioning or flagellar assembly